MIVVDASIALAWVLPNTDTEQNHKRWRDPRASTRMLLAAVPRLMSPSAVS